jgi:uncharacterized metal-binding protein
MSAAKPKILVYSCSGASSAAQMANWIAIQLDRRGLAEMSCVAGIGGGVKALVAKAGAADIIISVDGCPLDCVEHCLSNQGLKSTVRYELSKLGVPKLMHADFDPQQANKVLEFIIDDLVEKKFFSRPS